MKRITLAVLLCGSMASMAQTVKVIELSPEDTRHIIEIDKSIATLQKLREDYLTHIRMTYIAERYGKGNDGCAAQSVDPIDGKKKCAGLSKEWWNGFEFSEDFRFIVPGRQAEFVTGGSWFKNCVMPTGSITAGPAAGGEPK